MPFVDRGRDWRGVDCWGLVSFIYRAELGIELPSYGDISATDLIRVSALIKADAEAEPWREAERPLRPFDVVMMRGRPWHVGLMASETTVLHIEEITDSVIVPIAHDSVRHRIIGFRRHRNLL